MPQLKSSKTQQTDIPFKTTLHQNNPKNVNDLSHAREAYPFLISQYCYPCFTVLTNVSVSG